MSIEIKVPVLPESVSDAVVISWYKQPGDFIKQDEPIVDIETDKVVLEIPAPVNGILTKIIENDGSTVIAGQVMGFLEQADQADDSAAVIETAESSDNSPAETTTVIDQELITPAAKKLLHEHNLDVNAITATGKGGRLLKEDVLAYIDNKLAETHETPAKPAPAMTGAATIAPATAATAASDSAPAKPEATEVPGGREEKRVPMTRLRTRIAERLLDAQHNAAILTTFNEVNMKPVMDIRAKYKDDFAKKHDVKLGFMSFFVKAAVAALKRFPAVNASIDGNDIVYHGYIDIGIAVSSPRGLVVPVLKNAERLEMAQIESAVLNFGQKARDNALSIDEITGGTFSITNGGIFGSLLSTPILNPPQSAILGMHKIQDRVVVENGEMVIRPIMYLALSYDHRIIDGREAVQFLVTIKDMLEDPSRLLLGL